MLYVWLVSQHSQLRVWLSDEKKWQLVANWQVLKDKFGKQPICLYFPSNQLLQVSSELSSSQLKQLGETGRQYLFEEISLTPVEQLLVRQVGSTNHHYLYALPKYSLEQWQQSLILVGLDLVAVLPDFLLLPIPKEGVGQQVILYQDDETILVRQSEMQGLAVSYLPLLLSYMPSLQEICLLMTIYQDDFNPSETIWVDDESLTQILWTRLRQQPAPMAQADRHELNFFVRQSGKSLSPYLKVTLMVAVVALLVQFAVDGMQWYRYSQANKATKQAMAEQYKSWFPNESLNQRTKVQLQLNSKLVSNAQAESGEVELLSRLSPLIKQSALVAQSLVIEPSSLRLTLLGSNRKSLDQFTNTLVAQGFQASLGSVVNTPDGVLGQLTVTLIKSDK